MIIPHSVSGFEMYRSSGVCARQHLSAVGHGGSCHDVCREHTRCHSVGVARDERQVCLGTLGTHRCIHAWRGKEGEQGDAEVSTEGWEAGWR